VTADLSSFWGKAGTSPVWHPAICHMVDVGMVAMAFLERPAGAALRRSLAKGLNTTEPQAVSLIAFLVAAHDLGKVSPGFQAKRADLAPNADGLAYRPAIDESDHGRVSLGAIRKGLTDRGFGTDAATGIARALGAHHGTFPAPVAFGRSPGGPSWEAARDAHLRALESIFEPELALVRGRDRFEAAWLMSLAGITSVCDWIGSSEDLFPWEQEGGRDLQAYARRSKDRGGAALVTLGFTGWAPPATPIQFSQTFGFPPNEMQARVIEAAVAMAGPGLMVVEAPMGLGKTEAALAAADVLLQRFGLAGVYYALPTQATSNQMFGRLVEFLDGRYQGLKVDLHLLHGLSDLNPDYANLRLSAISQDPDATVRASSWFTASKRGLLAPFGVGTIDQALLSVLAVRHVFVRLLGLAQKVVILDEVHAYDTYMSELLDHLLGWLAALGSPVIVLSATLPAPRRQALLAAYSGEAPEPTPQPYPLISLAERGVRASAVSFAAGRSSRISLVRWDPSEGARPEATAARLASLLADGGCAAWICNTVGRAQAAYLAATRAMTGLDCQVSLFHARFPTGARLRVEEAVLSSFGKKGPRPRRALLVATQVVEQSLDLDFDFMVTDLAPLDLVLQRAGRLHRHGGRVRPADLALPRLAWLDLPEQGGVPELGAHGLVYDPYVLLRSWIALRSRSGVSLPEDIATLIDEVYGGALRPARPELAAAIDAARDRREGAVRAATQKAVAIEIRPPATIDDLADAHQVLLEDEESADLHQTLQARTRLTRPSITVVCAHRRGGELFLDDGSPLDVQGRPGREVVRSARRSSLSLQRWEWFDHFRRQPVPEPWTSVAALRDCRLAVFQEGALEVPGLRTRLRLSPDLGLVVEPLA
jgi:CRISPR-associated endonuclease/helicase Cas3